MDRKIVLGVIVAAVLGFFAVLLLMPPTIDDGTPRLPWRTGLDESGRTQVFGFTLGRTTLAEVRRVFGEEGTLNLFENPSATERFGAEAFFEQIYLQSLRANFVMTLEADQQLLAAMYERGLRISKMESGSRRIKLDPADSEALADRPIRSIAYLPQARLDDALIAQRFGTPAERRTEPDSGIVHWLYPERGMDIALDPKGKAVIQYVNPSEFQHVTQPLPAPGNAAPQVAPAG